MADVFISYHEESTGENSDGRLVPKIADALESNGISCWYAERDLIASGSFARAITREIRSCKIFLLVLNEESNQSLYVEAELRKAFERMSRERKNNNESMAPVIFKVDNCILSDAVDFYAGIFQITNGNPPNECRIQKLAERISTFLHIVDST